MGIDGEEESKQDLGAGSWDEGNFECSTHGKEGDGWQEIHEDDHNHALCNFGVSDVSNASIT